MSALDNVHYGFRPSTNGCPVK